MQKRQSQTSVQKILWLFLIIFAFQFSFLPAQNEDSKYDANWSPYKVNAPLDIQSISVKAFYLPMRDGIKIAVNLYIPKELTPEAKLPTILHATRYWRAADLRLPSGEKMPNTRLRIRRFLANGYAFVSMDSRGTGASEGTWPCPWGPDEVKDYSEVADWIISQPWSNGRIGTAGISYDGTTAEMSGVNKHPAVKAIVPEFSLYDAYADIGLPGGIHMTEFTRKWSEGNDMLDQNTSREIKRDGKVQAIMKGVMPVDEDTDSTHLQKIVAARLYNCNVYEAALHSQFIDDVWICAPSITMFTYSPCGHQAAFRETGVPMYSYSGWFDGAYPHSAIKRHITIQNSGSKLVLGPWNHGGSFNASPAFQDKTRFDHVAELMRFFDHHLKDKDTGINDEPPIHYYTMGEEKWKSAESWPPKADDTIYYLSSGHNLSAEVPLKEEAYDQYRADYSAATGLSARWDTLLGGTPVIYPNRAEEDKKLLTYTSAPLESEMEVTGHPIITLYIASTASDGQFFAYLEDVDENGKVTYVTEGELRALHRKISEDPQPYSNIVPYHSFKRKDGKPLIPGNVTKLVFDLLPTSYLFKKGHSIRIALASADKDHFAPSAF
ncbi:CocE/NonD family hydrolase, partial [Acidobacteriota bacterium]